MREPALLRRWRKAVSNHSSIALFEGLCSRFSDSWQARGYALTSAEGTYIIDGDMDQFYLDAVAIDTYAHFAAEFLRLHDSPTWFDLIGMAQNDGIEMTLSQDALMQRKSLHEHLALLPAPIFE